MQALCLPNPPSALLRRPGAATGSRARNPACWRLAVVAGSGRGDSDRSSADHQGMSLPKKPQPRMIDRRETLSVGIASLAGALALSQGAAFAEEVPAVEGVDTTITHTVYIEVGVCGGGKSTDPFMESDNVFCDAPSPLGRIVIGLYGNAAPVSVESFLALVTGEAGESYKGTTFHKVLPGEYISAGQQGKRRNGQIEKPKLPRSREMLTSSAYRLRHARPGTVSWCVGANDDEPFVQEQPGYQNSEFLITSGPAPAFSLDGENIVIGRVLEGLPIVSIVAASPTFKPQGVLLSYNALGSAVGDRRAAVARKAWVRPKAPVVITDCGVISVAGSEGGGEGAEAGAREE